MDLAGYPDLSVPDSLKNESSLILAKIARLCAYYQMQTLQMEICLFLCLNALGLPENVRGKIYIYIFFTDAISESFQIVYQL